MYRGIQSSIPFNTDYIPSRQPLFWYRQLSCVFSVSSWYTHFACVHTTHVHVNENETVDANFLATIPR